MQTKGKKLARYLPGWKLEVRHEFLIELTEQEKQDDPRHIIDHMTEIVPIIESGMMRKSIDIYHRDDGTFEMILIDEEVERSLPEVGDTPVIVG